MPFILVMSVIALAFIVWEPTTALRSRLSFLPTNTITEPVDGSEPVEFEDPSAIRIYLTFDDGPSSEATPAILEILDSFDIRATFFITGYLAERMPDIVRYQDSKGHVIANHSYSHNYGTIYASAEAFMMDIEHAEQVFTEILGSPPPRIMRFPAGSAASQLDNSPEMRDAIKASLSAGGWRYFDWNVSIGDSISGWVPNAGELGTNLIARIEEQVAHGATDIIVLAHDMDSKPWTPKDLPMVIEHCKQQGYVFKTLSLDSPPVEFR